MQWIAPSQKTDVDRKKFQQVSQTVTPSPASLSLTPCLSWVNCHPSTVSQPFQRLSCTRLAFSHNAYAMDHLMPMPDAAIDSFIARWSAASASERSNSQPFLSELCDLLGVERPHATF